ncbi:retroviral-like aspartic protease family protein [Alteromonas oceani]|uniref:Retroviral-like aspartic protease family protein n=1 Tax=Alteromonas oceani TaxID=2071609 RepID=A0ABV7JRS7_9ALTE|nr:retropepsin-like aspartic protease [Alteromonas oceani]
MTRFALVVSVCLLISVSLNVYLLWGEPAPTAAEDVPKKTGNRVTSDKATKPPVSTPQQSASTYQAESGTSDKPDVPATDIDIVQQWLDQGDFARVERFLIDALRANPDSAQLLLLEADYILATEPLSVGVSHLFALQELSLFNLKQREELANRSAELIENTISALYNAGDWDMLAQFLEPLFQLNSSDQTLTLKLAEAYARQQKFTLMEDVLANLSANNAGARSLRQRFLPGPLPTSEQSNEGPIDTQQEPVTRLALTRYGDQYIAETQILNRPAALLLDTGTSSTAISFELYKALRRFNQIKVIGLFDVRTAGGPIRSPLVQIDNMTLGPYKLSNIGVFVMPEAAMQQADGLLGMNVLKQFHFQLDQTNAELLLTPRQ